MGRVSWPGVSNWKKVSIIANAVRSVIAGSGVSGVGVTAYAGFTPLNLFAAGEKGGWYDPSDISTMFQIANTNHIYTTPVTTTGQSVGLILDKSKGLAVTATSIDNNLNTATWTKGSGWTAPDGRTLICDGTQGGATTVTTATHPAVLAGFLCRWTFTVTAISGGNLTVWPNNASTVLISVPGTTVVYSGASSTCTFSAALGVSCTITNIKIEYVAGTHLVQETGGNRPVYTVSGQYAYLAFNGTTSTMVSAR